MGEETIMEKCVALLEETANMLRGMTMDPAIPGHAKGAMHSRIAELEAMVDAAINSI